MISNIWLFNMSFWVGFFINIDECYFNVNESILSIFRSDDLDFEVIGYIKELPPDANLSFNLNFLISLQKFNQSYFHLKHSHVFAWTASSTNTKSSQSAFILLSVQPSLWFKFKWLIINFWIKMSTYRVILADDSFLYRYSVDIVVFHDPPR